MSGALSALAILKALGVGTPRDQLAACVDAYRLATTDLRKTDDLLGGMQAVAAMVLALEALATAAEAHAKTARAILAQTMQDTGATRFDVGHHTVNIADRPRRVDVFDRHALPPEWLRQPPPEPDKTAIGAALRGGKTVPGARLDNGGPPIVQFRGHKEKAA